MSQFRKDEIARNADQVRSVFQKMKTDDKSDDAAAVVSAMSGVLGLLVGIASDLNEINERLEQANKIASEK